ncbi:MAG: asparagine synthase (glutamine-hydrolyzing) [Acidobacteria bacterium]|nr:asparagine synthase (glutamine-hydrolyzing) [Acidobacteriota bacterium]
MCGIVGILEAPASDLESSLLRATRALAHRGPDAEATQIIDTGLPGWVLGLGARRLAILDLSPAGNQPMLDRATGNWIVHNGEVYNFRQLRGELEAAGQRFCSQSDTEVLLHSYAVWGKDCVLRWRGMFATAIWDARQRQLVLFRDRLGIKPLYYHPEASRLSFASEVRTLVKGGWVAPRLDPTALESFLSFGAVQEPLTIVAGVRAVPPGHRLVWQEGRWTTESYWDPIRTRPAGVPTSEALPELLLEAARLRLVSDVPLGVFLSGGIDSSSLVSLLRGAAGAELQTVTVVFSENTASDALCARRLAEKFGTRHHELLLDESELLRQLPGALAAMDQPTANGINTYLISRAVRADGIKVALSGLGGDELFGGYPSFRQSGLLGGLRSVSARLPRWGRRALAGLTVLWPAAPEAKRKLHFLFQGENGFADPVFLLRALFLPAQVAQLLTPEAILSLDYGDYAQTLRTSLEQASELDPFARTSWLELRHYLLNTLLRDTDQMSMAHGLEVREPLLDQQLVEVVLGLPRREKANGRVPKEALVRSLPQPLPPEIVQRRKVGFTLPFERWLRGPLRSDVEDVLTRSSSPLALWLRPGAVAQVWKEFLAGRQSWSRPWALYVVQRWAEASGARL